MRAAQNVRTGNWRGPPAFAPVILLARWGFSLIPVRNMGIQLPALLSSHPCSQHPGSITAHELAVLDKHPIANLPYLNFHGLLEPQIREALRLVGNYTVEHVAVVMKVRDPNVLNHIASSEFTFNEKILLIRLRIAERGHKICDRCLGSGYGCVHFWVLCLHLHNRIT